MSTGIAGKFKKKVEQTYIHTYNKFVDSINQQATSIGQQFQLVQFSRGQFYGHSIIRF